MKKLAKKQNGGYVKSPVKNQAPSYKKEIKGSQAESMKPNAKQPKFDASKVSTSGAKIKGADKVGSGTYTPDTTRYKKTGGAVSGKKISVAKSPRPSTAGTGSAGKYVTPKKSGMLKLGGSIKSKKK